MTIDDEKFFAWLDGELPPDEAAHVEAEVASSAELTRAAEQHRAMQARLAAAFATITDAPVPERLKPRPNVIDFAAAKARRGERWFSSPVPWVAMAATLALGIFTGTMINPKGSGPVEVQGGKLYAASKLDAALNTELTSTSADRPIQVGLTFRDHSGVICRTFSDQQSSGLACRQGSGWQLRALFPSFERQAGTYRMAQSMNPNLASIVDSTIAGDPLDAAQEKMARANGWR